MEYPGRIIKVGESDPLIMRAVKQQLNTMLAIDDDPSLRLDPAYPNFGAKVKQLVLLFQAQQGGRPAF
jgi:hypothetical protein